MLRVGNLSSRRDLTDVRDVCRAYGLLLARDVPSGVYNVASGTAVGMRDVVDLLVSMVRCPVRVEVEEARLRPADLPIVCGDASGGCASPTLSRSRDDRPLEVLGEVDAQLEDLVRLDFYYLEKWSIWLDN